MSEAVTSGISWPPQIILSSAFTGMPRSESPPMPLISGLVGGEIIRDVQRQHHQKPTFNERQRQQLDRFLKWVREEGGIERPTHIRTMLQPHQIGRLEWMKDNLLGITGKILECGTNWGFVTAYVGGHAGIDINPQNIELARVLQPQAEFTVGNIIHLPYPDKSFQAVLVPETLEHLDFEQEVPAALREAERVAQERLLITFPDGDRDTPDATSFKHRWLCDHEHLRAILAMLPGKPSVNYAHGFVLIRCDL